MSLTFEASQMQYPKAPQTCTFGSNPIVPFLRLISQRISHSLHITLGNLDVLLALSIVSQKLNRQVLLPL